MPTTMYWPRLRPSARRTARALARISVLNRWRIAAFLLTFVVVIAAAESTPR
ncbi:hypothetical protein [Streptomyces sp. NPDC050485]|uniref:hypothetical protein n=1 Tax=Streptomyces sp. NPDC050485 TaxID=3365617 RepID=UPI0037944173